MRVSIVVLALLATPVAGQDTYDLSPPPDRPEGAVEIKIDRFTEYHHRQVGGATPRDRIEVELAKRRIRFRHLEPDPDGNERIEVEYLSDRISHEGATYGLGDRTVVATRTDSIEVTLQKIVVEEGVPIALLEIEVEIEERREERRVRTVSQVRGLGEIWISLQTRRIVSWHREGTISEENQITVPDDEPTILGYEAWDRTTEEYSYD